MKTGLKRFFAGFVVGSAMLATVPANAETALGEEQALRTFDIMLMVTALRCRTGADDFQADYYRFAARHIGTLNRAGATLRADFASTMGPRSADRALDRMGVRIANSYGDGHPWMGCAQLGQLARELAVTTDPAALASAAHYALAAAPVQRSQPQVTIAYSSANLIDAERFASR